MTTYQECKERAVKTATELRRHYIKRKGWLDKGEFSLSLKQGMTAITVMHVPTDSLTVVSQRDVDAVCYDDVALWEMIMLAGERYRRGEFKKIARDYE